jgi:predicted nucleic acid-binding protein
LKIVDSLIYATAVSMAAELITSDADFASLPGVTYLAKPKPGPPAPG